MNELKPLHQSAIPTCLEKARHYRLLNDPENAESICLDILELQSDHQEALTILILSITDQFDGGTKQIRRAKGFLDQITDEYNQAYHRGLILERAARAALGLRTRDGHYAAYEWLGEAKDCYEKAESLSSDENDDAILRWNACTRTLVNQDLKPRPADSYHQSYGDS